MLDLTNGRYLEPGTNIGGLPQLPASVIDVAVKEIDEAAINGIALDGYAFSPTDKRYSWISALHQNAMVPETVSQIPNFAEQIRVKGLEAIPLQKRVFFPATFYLTEKFPPTVLLHGSEDCHVRIDQSSDVAAKLRALGVDVLFETVAGQGHGFDVRGIPKDVDIHAYNAGDPEFYNNFRRTFAFLDQAVQKAT